MKINSWSILFFLIALSCTPIRKLSSVKIAGGTEIDETEFPSVVKLMITQESKTIGMCTGNFVSDNPPALITAAHCIPLINGIRKAQNNHESIVFNGVKSKHVCALRFHSSGKISALDLAVVVFSPSGFRVPGITKLDFATPIAGQPVFFIGFGLDSDLAPQTFGKKRYGANKIFNISSGKGQFPEHEVIELRGEPRGREKKAIKDVNDESNSSAHPGDSGMPLFKFSNLKDEAIQIGVLSGGFVSAGILSSTPNEKDINHDYYVTFSDSLVKNFLQKALIPEFLLKLSKGHLPPGYSEICSI